MFLGGTVGRVYPIGKVYFIVTGLSRAIAGITPFVLGYSEIFLNVESSFLSKFYLSFFSATGIASSSLSEKSFPAYRFLDLWLLLLLMVVLVFFNAVFVL